MIFTGGKGCTVYDVVINQTFFERTQRSQVMLGFFLSVVLEGLEQKYDTTLDRGIVLSHKKLH